VVHWLDALFIADYIENKLATIIKSETILFSQLALMNTLSPPKYCCFIIAADDNGYVDISDKSESNLFVFLYTNHCGPFSLSLYLYAFYDQYEQHKHPTGSTNSRTIEKC